MEPQPRRVQQIVELQPVLEGAGVRLPSPKLQPTRSTWMFRCPPMRHFPTPSSAATPPWPMCSKARAYSASLARGADRPFHSPGCLSSTTATTSKLALTADRTDFWSCRANLCMSPSSVRDPSSRTPRRRSSRRCATCAMAPLSGMKPYDRLMRGLFRDRQSTPW